MKVSNSIKRRNYASRQHQEVSEYSRESNRKEWKGKESSKGSAASSGGRSPSSTLFASLELLALRLRVLLLADARTRALLALDVAETSDHRRARIPVVVRVPVRTVYANTASVRAMWNYRNHHRTKKRKKSKEAGPTWSDRSRTHPLRHSTSPHRRLMAPARCRR